MNYHGIDFSDDELAEICQYWRVKELSLFGSVLRNDFGPDGKIDVLVTFQPDAAWCLWDMRDICEDLQRLFGRSVDLIDEDALSKSPRRDEILGNHKVLYAA